jgi:hypothetical protein
MHTPDILTQLICNSMDSWLARRPVLLPAWNGPEEPIQQQIRSAFKTQAKIGWDQFFHGRIAKAWRIPIGTWYHKIRQLVVTHSHRISVLKTVNVVMC